MLQWCGVAWWQPLVSGGRGWAWRIQEALASKLLKWLGLAMQGEGLAGLSEGCAYRRIWENKHLEIASFLNQKCAHAVPTPNPTKATQLKQTQKSKNTNKNQVI